MGFKSKKIKTTEVSEKADKTEKKSKFAFKKSITYSIWFLFICIIIFLWTLIVWNIKNFNFDFNLNFWSILSGLKSNIKYNSQEKTEDKVNILLTWIWWPNHSWWNLTDTIILVSLDFNKNVISMLSIPRDLYVKYGTGSYWKINWEYVYGLSREKDESKAMWYLESKITQITWQKIDYYVNIDFTWFIKIVDLLWWVTVDVPETLVDTSYPTWNWWYTTFVLKKWTWTLDWETALKYARSRHSTNDFDRSLRQQKILSAIKEKLSQEWYLSNPFKIKELYNTISPYFTTDIWLSWILKIASDFKELQTNNKIISLNLNNSCYYGVSYCKVWWLLYTPPMENFWWASVVLPIWATAYKLEIYSKIQRFANLIFNYQKVFTDKQEINIFNSLSVANKAMYLANDLQQFGFNVPEKNSIWNTDWETYEKTTIYYNNIWDDTETLNALKLFIKWVYIKTNLPKFSKNPDTKIEIIIWKDFDEVSDFDWSSSK